MTMAKKGEGRARRTAAAAPVGKENAGGAAPYVFQFAGGVEGPNFGYYNTGLYVLPCIVGWSLYVDILSGECSVEGDARPGGQ